LKPFFTLGSSFTLTVVLGSATRLLYHMSSTFHWKWPHRIATHLHKRYSPLQMILVVLPKQITVNVYVPLGALSE